MEWAKENATWPLAQHSRFVVCKPHRWHIQDIGSGPTLLLLHGAGGSTHSWRHLIPYLNHYRAVAIDLPGQGFTRLGAQRRCKLDAMAEDIIALLNAENLRPAAIIGHSAGAAIALRVAERMPVPQIIGINAALDTFHGVAGVLFPLLAKAIATLPFAASVFSATASQGQTVDRIIKGTGSTLSTADRAYYRRLVASSDHVHGTLRMMAQWQLEPLLSRLPEHGTQTILIAAENDIAVPPQTTQHVAAHMPNAQAVMIPHLGHLAHEEDAGAIAPHILNALTPQTQTKASTI